MKRSHGRSFACMRNARPNAPSVINHSANYLVGTSLQIPADGILTHLGVIAKAIGPHVQLGLYTESAGEPDVLVAVTHAEVLAGGENWFPVTATAIAAGKYWIMGVYDADASIGQSASDSTVIKYRDLVFSVSLPATFGTATTYSGPSFNYFVHVIH